MQNAHAPVFDWQITGSSRNLGGRAAWGRVCGRAKLLAGTLRCLRLCWRLPWDWSNEEQLGRCPKPHKGRCPLTLQWGSLDYHIKCNTAPKKERHCVRFVLE